MAYFILGLLAGFILKSVFELIDDIFLYQAKKEEFNAMIEMLEKSGDGKLNINYTGTNGKKDIKTKGKR